MSLSRVGSRASTSKIIPHAATPATPHISQKRYKQGMILMPKRVKKPPIGARVPLQSDWDRQIDETYTEQRAEDDRTRSQARILYRMLDRMTEIGADKYTANTQKSSPPLIGVRMPLRMPHFIQWKYSGLLKRSLPIPNLMLLERAEGFPWYKLSNMRWRIFMYNFWFHWTNMAMFMTFAYGNADALKHIPGREKPFKQPWDFMGILQTLSVIGYDWKRWRPLKGFSDSQWKPFSDDKVGPNAEFLGSFRAWLDSTTIANRIWQSYRDSEIQQARTVPTRLSRLSSAWHTSALASRLRAISRWESAQFRKMGVADLKPLSFLGYSKLSYRGWFDQVGEKAVQDYVKLYTLIGDTRHRLTKLDLAFVEELPATYAQGIQNGLPRDMNYRVRLVNPHAHPSNNRDLNHKTRTGIRYDIIHFRFMAGLDATLPQATISAPRKVEDQEIDFHVYMAGVKRSREGLPAFTKGQEFTFRKHKKKELENRPGKKKANVSQVLVKITSYQSLTPRNRTREPHVPPSKVVEYVVMQKREIFDKGEWRMAGIVAPPPLADGEIPLESGEQDEYFRSSHEYGSIRDERYSGPPSSAFIQKQEQKQLKQPGASQSPSAPGISPPNSGALVA